MTDRLVTVTFNPAIDKVLSAPHFVVGNHMAAQRIGSYPAGKGINIARVVVTLGGRCVATGFVGREEFARFEQFLEKVGEGRAVTQLLTVRGETRENITITDPARDTETHIRDEGFTVTPGDMRRLTSKIGMLARPGVIVALAGSLPPGMTIGDLRTIVHRCQDQDCKLVIDTSSSALESLRDEPFWLTKLNAKELATLSIKRTETREQVIEAARSISTKYGGHVSVVVATRGAEGAILISETAELAAYTFVHPGRIASTVGSGDALLAGLLLGYQRSGDWASALKLGMAAATANATSRVPGSISLDECDEFEEVTTIESIEDGSPSA